MIPFILIISFLLHITTLFAVYQLLKQINVLKKKKISESAELFEKYLQEIKDENSRLQEHLVEHKTETTDTSESMPSSVDDALIAHSPSIDNADKVEASLQARILQLHNKGLSETEIAQKLNCGKTEAALIIKIHA
ncbi:DUF6115 domain-containing protein [Virgibacillus ainsalahensis]